MTNRRNRCRPLALGYIRVSTAEQANEGASLDAQRAALTTEATKRGWDLEIVADEGRSGKDLHRPGLTSALDRLDRRDADALLSIRIDRVSRSVVDFAGIIARAKRRGWQIVLLSPNLDTNTPGGKFTSHVLAAAAEYERDLIGARVREAMAQRRAEGVHLGRPSSLPAAVVARIVAERAAGASLARIADALTSEGVPRAHAGARWYPSTVAAILKSTAAQQ